MSRSTSLVKTLVLTVAVVLVTVSQSQAAPPAGGNSTGGGHHHGWNHHQGTGFGYGRFYPGYFGNGGLYGYPYSNLGYVYAAREQQYQTALVLQAQQYRAALLQVQLQQARADQQRAQQAEQTPGPKQPTPARAFSRPRASERQVILSLEDRAAGKLKMANVLAEDGQTADAADYFREIVQQYPGTLAARQAQQSLDKVTQR